MTASAKENCKEWTCVTSVSTVDVRYISLTYSQIGVSFMIKHKQQHEGTRVEVVEVVTVVVVYSKLPIVLPSLLLQPLSRFTMPYW